MYDLISCEWGKIPGNFKKSIVTNVKGNPTIVLREKSSI